MEKLSDSQLPAPIDPVNVNWYARVPLEEPIILQEQADKFHSMFIESGKALLQLQDTLEAMSIRHGKLHETWSALQRLTNLSQES